MKLAERLGGNMLFWSSSFTSDNQYEYFLTPGQYELLGLAGQRDS